jgi:hypothetical protein
MMRTLVAVPAVLVLAGCSASVQIGTPDTPSPSETLAIDAAALATEIGSKVGVAVTVDCPPDIPIQKDLVTQCTVTDGKATNTLIITQTDDQGNVHWKIGDVVSPAPSAS